MGTFWLLLLCMLVSAGALAGIVASIVLALPKMNRPQFSLLTLMVMSIVGSVLIGANIVEREGFRLCDISEDATVTYVKQIVLRHGWPFPHREVFVPGRGGGGAVYENGWAIAWNTVVCGLLVMISGVCSERFLLRRWKSGEAGLGRAWVGGVEREKNCDA